MRCWLRAIRTTDSGQSARKTRRRARCGEFQAGAELQAGRQDALRRWGVGWACSFSESPRAPGICVRPLIAGVPSALSRNAGGEEREKSHSKAPGVLQERGKRETKDLAVSTQPRQLPPPRAPVPGQAHFYTRPALPGLHPSARRGAFPRPELSGPGRNAPINQR